MRIFIFTLSILLIQQSSASTFVGNGGNAGDLELHMTLRQIERSLQYINRDKDREGQNLCTCTQRFEGRPLCEVLKHLNTEQVLFCSNFITLKAGDMARLAVQMEEVGFSWTHQEIEVQEAGKLRGADAVTDARNKTIILNQKRFLEMDENEKLFLVGHELFHLTSFQGETLSDMGGIGPFKGEEGGRQFINALAATVVLQANEYDVFKAYEEAERRSKSYKKNWLAIGVGSVSTENNADTAFDIERATGGHVAYRYQWTQEFGLLAQFSSLAGTKKILSTIEATEKRNIFSVGAAYRWFPFSNPLTAGGQSHFLFGATMDFLSGTYEFHDLNPGITSKTSSVGYELSCNYFLPLNAGVWVYGGVGYTNLHYSFNLDNQMDLNYENNGTAFSLGVSYGF